MISAGAALLLMGVAVYWYGYVGRLMERRWKRLSPGDQQLPALGQFQLGRQRAMIRRR
jgi:hypothetical protein